MLSGDIAKLFLWYYVGFFIIFARIYQKHHAATDERQFIETHVKAME